jgi:hypothetical protein
MGEREYDRRDEKGDLRCAPRAMLTLRSSRFFCAAANAVMIAAAAPASTTTTRVAQHSVSAAQTGAVNTPDRFMRLR